MFTLLSASYLKFTRCKHTRGCTRAHSGSVTMDDVVQSVWRGASVLVTINE